MEIEKIDKNFLTERSIPENARIFDVRNDPFEINGVFFSGGHFVRMPEEDAKKVNPGVRELHACTAGGRVRFSTDSSFLAVIADLNSVCPMSHAPYVLPPGLTFTVTMSILRRFSRRLIIRWECIRRSCRRTGRCTRTRPLCRATAVCARS